MAIAVKLALAAIAALLAGVAIAPSARAVDVYKDSAGTVYLSGLRPKEIVKIAYRNIPNRIKVRASGSCNIVKIPYKASEPGFYPWDGVTIFDGAQQVVSLTGNSLPKYDELPKLCNGNQKNDALNWQSLGNGVYGLQHFTKALYLAGLPFKQFEAEDGEPKIRLKNADTCGIVRLTDTPAYQNAQLGNFYFYAQSENDGLPSAPRSLASLETRSTPEVCRNGVFYKPCLNGACDAAGPGYAGQPYTGGSGGSSGSNGSNNGSGGNSNNGSNNGSNGSNNGSGNGSSGSGGTIGGGGS